MSEYISGLYAEYDFTPTQTVVESYRFLTPRQLELCVWWSARRGAIGSVTVYEDDQYGHNFNDFADSLGIDVTDLLFDVCVLVDAGILDRGESHGSVFYNIVSDPFSDPPDPSLTIPF